MYRVYEIDSPEENYVNADVVIDQLLKEEQKSGAIKAVLLSKRKWSLSKKENFTHSLILSSRINELFGDILKNAQEGFSVFIYTKSSVSEIAHTPQKNGYVFADQAISLSDLPIESDLEKEILEFISDFDWKGRVIFFAHDGFPIYILDSVAE